MPEEMAGTDAWAGLLTETRQALATLRAQDLELLAARAERMLTAAGAGQRPTGRPEDRPANMIQVAAEHRLLGDLLLATGRNLEVLRRLRDRMQAGEGNSRWGL